MASPQYRTLLEQLVRESLRTMEETCSAFEAKARELGEQATLSPRQLARWMGGDVSLPRPVAQRMARAFWGHTFQELLGAPEAAGRHENHASSIVPANVQVVVLTDDGDSSHPSDPEHHEFESVDAIDHRRLTASESNVDNAMLSYIDTMIHDVIGTYEQRSPLQLEPQIRALRARVHDLIGGRQPPRQRWRLYTAAAQISGIHGVLALDLGELVLAERYGAEAYAFAEAVHDPDLYAWVRAGQSLIAYYSGKYHDAVAFARDGYTRSPRGPQAVRLAVNGEARALARLGDGPGVDDAVGRGLAVLECARGDTVSPSMSLSSYCSARAAANAATAYLVLGRHSDARSHAQLSLTAFDRAELHGPRALSRLDLATAELQRPRGDLDLDYACSVAVEALTLSGGYTYESVALRAMEFLNTAEPWSGNAAVRDVAGLVEQLSRRKLPAIPSTP
ncbi:XRE family transcriptional regulator [Dactylosporangium sp. NPDC005555]|uniref:XRE family transcriptional regulator n=1 Tax=Dactylosporangium sp. NPDC005555 TaxID=3154889 RepID=UPI0033BAD627